MPLHTSQIRFIPTDATASFQADTEGAIYYDDSESLLKHYDGSSWITLNLPNIVTDGLVLSLDAAQNDSYPGSGATWYDLSGNGLNGTIYGPTFDSGNGGSLIFDGTDDYITCAANSYWALGDTSWTIDAWLKPETSAIHTVLCGAGGAGAEYWSSILESNNTAGFSWKLSGGTGFSTGSYTNGSWVHYVLTVNRAEGSDGTWRLYLNGSNVVELPGGVSHSTGDDQGNTNIAGGEGGSDLLYIGAGRYNNDWHANRFLSGSLASVKVYNKNVSAAEVLQNFNAHRHRFGM